jgi:hypothetical protein
MSWQFKQFFTGLVLVFLAAGFTSLGVLSFVRRQAESAINDFSSEATYSIIIGGSISILVGGIFLAAAILFAGMLLRRRSFQTPEHRNGEATPMD